MAFSSSPLAEAFPPRRFDSPGPSPGLSPAPSPTRTEVDFPADVDQSFNSSMSFSNNDSPTQNSPTHRLGTNPVPCSPTNLVLRPPRRPELTKANTALGVVRDGSSFRPAAPGRVFGRELSLNRPSSAGSFKGSMLPPAVPEGKVAESPGRLPWTMSHEDVASPKVLMPRLGRRDSAPQLESPATRRGLFDAMDVDSPQRPRSNATSPSTQTSSPGLGSFFCESPAAPMLPPAKRRNIASSSPASPSSSPSTRRPRCDKTASSSALLFGVPPRPSTLASRRSAPYKRPPLQPVQATEGSRSTATSSAYPILYGPPKPPRAVPAMRRAFSVCDQHMDSSDDEDIDGSPSVSITHAEYQRRHGHKRVDGSPHKHRSLVPSVARTCDPEHKASPYGPGGLPGFGDNEVDGKILPCHKVKEDGLVRITADTLDGLLAGCYKDKMKRYHILDCRFDYEYNGGHIAGAVNVKNQEQLDELLLTAMSGMNCGDESLPSPSRSGELESSQQVVLIFHCEFSAKRAPTFAKHLRSRDRMLNNAIYPKIHYPELYILEGGYCSFYQRCPQRCEPQAYVPMDDPRHLQRRAADLHDFRKFSRTRSFTYGELQQYPTRQPPCPPLAFAAASVAVTRRGGATIDEEHEPDSSPAPFGASPCPRVLSMGQAPIFGSAKTRTLQRAGFQRVASCADAMVRR